MAANRVANDLNLARFPSEGRDNYITNHGFMRSWGAAVPSDGATGYGKGCQFFHKDGSGVTTLLYINNGDKDSCAFKQVFVFTQGSALTAQLTTITHTAPGTPDYAIQNFTQSSPFGFVTADEANTVLSVIANLQARVAELEARLEALGLVAAN